MNGKRRNYRKRPATKKTLRKSSRRPRVTTAVKRYVKRAIHSNIENKLLNWNYNGALLPYNAPTSSWLAYNVHALYPNSTTLSCTQGTGQSNRIGNSIKIQKGMLKFVISPKIYNATTNPFPQPYDIRVMIGYVKNSPVTGPSFTDFSELFQSGNTFNGPTTTLSDMIQQVNSNSFGILYDKVIKVGSASSTGTGGVAGWQYMANNDYKFNVVRKINITKYLTKTYQFNDTNNNPKSGRALFVWYLPSQAIGESAVSTYQPLNIYTSVDLQYEDA